MSACSIWGRPIRRVKSTVTPVGIVISNAGSAWAVDPLPNMCVAEIRVHAAVGVKLCPFFSNRPPPELVPKVEMAIAEIFARLPPTSAT